MGITPACAGKRLLVFCLETQTKDHPRVCGEKCPLVSGFIFGWGSPPRMRGKVAHDVDFFVIRGITPACAGKSWPMNTQTRRQGDHPRVCGEKLTDEYPDQAARGSPPRVRGKAQGYFWGFRLCGITPACAGKRASFPSPLLHGWDHPRVCGEKQQILSNGNGKQGITPACAGKSRTAQSWPGIPWDHPRVCGEK